MCSPCPPGSSPRRRRRRRPDPPPGADHRRRAGRVAGRPGAASGGKDPSNYRTVVDLLRHCLNGYGHQYLDDVERARFEHAFDAGDEEASSSTCSAYDAMYVALAEALACELVTGDQRLDTAPGLRCVIRILNLT